MTQVSDGALTQSEEDIPLYDDETGAPLNEVTEMSPSILDIRILAIVAGCEANCR